MGNSRILITGINGFIGNNLRKYIEAKYPVWDIYGIDKEGCKLDNFSKVDIRDKKRIERILYKIRPEIIFHLAGSVSVNNFDRLISENVCGTFHLLETIREMMNYCPRVIIPGSASEYGRVCSLKMPIKESCKLNPLSLYGYSKMAQTRLSLFFAEKGLDITVVRIFNIIGEGTPVSSSIGKFAYDLALIKKHDKEPVLYTKNLNSKRDFLDIEDVCKYLTAVALYGKRGEIYNVCRGKSYRIKDILKILIDIAGIKHIKIKEEEIHDSKVEIEDSYGSVKKLEEIIKISNLVPIEESLRNTFRYYYKFKYPI